MSTKKHIKRQRNQQYSTDSLSNYLQPKVSKCVFRILKQIIQFDELEALRNKYSTLTFQLDNSDLGSLSLPFNPSWHYEVRYDPNFASKPVLCIVVYTSDAPAINKMAGYIKPSKNCKRESRKHKWLERDPKGLETYQSFKSKIKESEHKANNYISDENIFLDKNIQPIIGIDTIWRKAEYNYYIRYKQLLADLNNLIMNTLLKRTADNVVYYLVSFLKYIFLLFIQNASVYSQRAKRNSRQPEKKMWTYLLGSACHPRY